MLIKYSARLVLKVCSYLLYFLTLLTAYGGFINPEWWTLPSMGVLFFPYFAMVTLLVAAVWLILRRWIVGSVGIGVLMLCGPTFSAALPFHFSSTADDPANTFKIVTFNTLHLQDLRNPAADWNRSLHFLTHCGADFICCQELYGFERPELKQKYQSQIDSLRAVYPYRTEDKRREVEFLSKYPFERVPIRLKDDLQYPNLGAYRVHIKGRELTIINVHLSSYMLSEAERKIITEATNSAGLKNSIKELEGSVYKKMGEAFKHRAKLSEAVADFAAGIEGNVIICGDFNDVPGSWAYRKFTKAGFDDAYAQTGFGHLITYNSHLMYFHIDQILFKGAMVPLYVKKVRMNASDHYPLEAEFEFIAP